MRYQACSVHVHTADVCMLRLSMCPVQHIMINWGSLRQSSVSMNDS